MSLCGTVLHIPKTKEPISAITILNAHPNPLTVHTHTCLVTRGLICAWQCYCFHDYKFVLAFLKFPFVFYYC